MGLRVRRHTRLHEYVCACIHVCVYECIYVCTCIDRGYWVCMYVCTYVAHALVARWTADPTCGEKLSREHVAKWRWGGAFSMRHSATLWLSRHRKHGLTNRCLVRQCRSARNLRKLCRPGASREKSSPSPSKTLLMLLFWHL